MSNLQTEIQQQINNGRLKTIFTIAEVISVGSIKKKYERSSVREMLANQSIGPGEREGEYVKKGGKILFRKFKERGTYAIYEDVSPKKTQKISKSKSTKKSRNMPIIKEGFLNDEAVSGFIEYLANLINGKENSFLHKYDNRQSKKEWSCNSLQDAFQKYSWNKKDYAATKKELDGYQTNLRKSFKLFKEGKNSPENEIEFMRHCRDILKWGGVLTNNEKWLENKKESHQLIMAFAKAKEILTHPAELKLDKGDWNEAGQRNTCNYRMNAGYTKIYSLLCNDFIIYDSRVAAALGKLVVNYLEVSKEDNFKDLDKKLAFKVMPAKEDKGCDSPKIRKSISQYIKFTGVNSSGFSHAEWNVKANWILTEAVKQAKMHWKDVNETDNLRALEAALFMIGYDLPENKNTNN